MPDGWARGEREGYGEPRDVTSLSLSLSYGEPRDVTSLSLSVSTRGGTAGTHHKKHSIIKNRS